MTVGLSSSAYEGSTGTRGLNRCSWYAHEGYGLYLDGYARWNWTKDRLETVDDE
jgi:hypothetical protein